VGREAEVGERCRWRGVCGDGREVMLVRSGDASVARTRLEGSRPPSDPETARGYIAGLTKDACTPPYTAG
jgi:hypothetical protein